MKFRPFIVNEHLLPISILVIILSEVLLKVMSEDASCREYFQTITQK